MKKAYTKKQIQEAISYWKKQLTEGNYRKVNEDIEDSDDAGYKIKPAELEAIENEIEGVDGISDVNVSETSNGISVTAKTVLSVQDFEEKVLWAVEDSCDAELNYDTVFASVKNGKGEFGVEFYFDNYQYDDGSADDYDRDTF